ncbi:MAG: ABC transporter permease, partial [Candidatus Limnocylindrales bacterium]
MGSRYFIRKTVGAVFTIFLIVILNFVLFRMMPGSPDRILLRNPNVSAEAVAATRARWGLDKPLIPDQLVDFLGATASGDLGYSFKFHGEE